jgi:hypothetical protein
MYEPQKRYQKRKYATDPAFCKRMLEWNKASLKRRRATPDGWALSEIRRIKHRCKERGMAFNIEVSDIPVPEFCPVLGIKITLGAPAHSPGLPSIDRLRPALGYVKGNIVVISWRANHLKNDCTDANELRKVADYMDRELAARQEPQNV